MAAPYPDTPAGHGMKPVTSQPRQRRLKPTQANQANLDTVRYTGATMKDMGAIEFAQEWGREEIAEIIRAYPKV